ncbi:hypothetical protein P8452_58429 [Trifolium repens]|nr:hypothetical protein P8452_58425 [Trifolium repens]WJX74819.1 hypothetical protein P8452_58429 [Trifolium repens]
MIAFAHLAKKKDASILFSIHYFAPFAAMRVVVADAARNVPAVAVPRLLNFQETYAEFNFHPFCCMK